MSLFNSLSRIITIQTTTTTECIKEQLTNRHQRCLFFLLPPYFETSRSIDFTFFLFRLCVCIHRMCYIQVLTGTLVQPGTSNVLQYMILYCYGVLSTSYHPIRYLYRYQGDNRKNKEWRTFITLYRFLCTSSSLPRYLEREENCCPHIIKTRYCYIAYTCLLIVMNCLQFAALGRYVLVHYFGKATTVAL